MKSSAVLANYYTSTELRQMAELRCTRMISNQPEIMLRPGMFCQPIDIGIDLAGNTAKAIPDMDGYPLRSLQNATEYITRLLEAGIRTVMVRMDAPAAYIDKRRLLERQTAVVHSLRSTFTSSDLQIIVDPFSIALNADKTWGVQSRGRLDYLRTAELFSVLTRCFAEAGADSILTLGRFEREVDIAMRTIAAHGSTMYVSSFSTNTETTNAYVYAQTQSYVMTDQKILVSNYDEMVFRALIDIYEGSHRVVIKPAENLHVLAKIVTLLSNPELLNAFLQSDQVETMIIQKECLRGVRDSILSDFKAYMDKAQAVVLGSYTVSGTYYTDTQTLRRKGDVFLKSLLYERYVNIAGITSAYCEPLIIDRNAGWFLTN